ncbi:MAG: DNA topoisomerase, partial [Marinicella sp.]
DDNAFDRSIKSRTFNDAKVTAHHAIIPKPKKADFSVLNKNEVDLYNLIATKYLQQFLPMFKYHENKMVISSGKFHFSSTNRSVNEIGFKSIGMKNDLVHGPIFNNYSKGDVVDIKLSISAKQTKPLPLYTYDTLLSELPRIAKYVKNEKLKDLLIEKDKDKPDEHGGIGTARTRDVILTNLISRGFMKEKGKSLIPTKTGVELINHLPDEITSPDMTALWHEQFKQIESGDKQIDEFLNSVYSFCDSHIKSTNQLNMSFDTYDCPKCGAFLRPLKLKSTKGKFWSCSKYPDCKFTAENKRNKPVHNA